MSLSCPAVSVFSFSTSSTKPFGLSRDSRSSAARAISAVSGSLAGSRSSSKFMSPSANSASSRRPFADFISCGVRAT